VGDGEWLVKPLASGGGAGIRPWRPRAWRGSTATAARRCARGCYLQERIDGTPGSVVFVAAKGRAMPLAVSRQLIGDAAFGAEGFRYCGSILAGADDPQFDNGPALVAAAHDLAAAVTDAFELVGVNGVDFIARHGVPHVIEVNPRWSASMELVERAHDLSVFAMHADACARAVLPDRPPGPPPSGALGKAIVFASEDILVGDTYAWLGDPSVADVPRPNEEIRAGSPICTVFAEGRDADACYDALVRRAADVYSVVAEWTHDEVFA
jgi:predicted ATP-grasp superfamily ATP-dependent carboligase